MAKPTLHIRKWSDTFETAKTRKLVRMEWLHYPADPDSNGYNYLMSIGTEGVLAYAVFTAICQWSAGADRLVNKQRCLMMGDCLVDEHTGKGFDTWSILYTMITDGLLIESEHETDDGTIIDYTP